MPVSSDDTSTPTARRRLRTAQSDRMGFAWEADELPDMTPAEAREILRLEDVAQKAGSFGNEDPKTLAYARLLVVLPGGRA